MLPVAPLGAENRYCLGWCPWYSFFVEFWISRCLSLKSSKGCHCFPRSLWAGPVASSCSVCCVFLWSAARLMQLKCSVYLALSCPNAVSVWETCPTLSYTGHCHTVSHIALHWRSPRDLIAFLPESQYVVPIKDSSLTASEGHRSWVSKGVSNGA